MVLQKKINLFKSKRFKDKVYLQKYWVEPPKLLSGNSKTDRGQIVVAGNTSPQVATVHQ